MRYAIVNVVFVISLNVRNRELTMLSMLSSARTSRDLNTRLLSVWMGIIGVRWDRTPAFGIFSCELGRQSSESLLKALEEREES